MKKFFTISSLLLLFSIFSTAQKTNLVFFSDQGEKFYVVLNGVLQNSAAETNVKVTDLVAPSYKLKIIFSDSTIATLDKNLMFEQGTESTFNIKKNNKGEYVVRFLNSVPIAEAPAPTAEQKVIILSTSGPSQPTAVTSTTISTTQTTIGTGVSPDGTSVGFHVNDPALGVNINMNMNTGNTATTSSYSTTTTTTTTTSGVQTQPVQVIEPQPTYVLQGYNGPYGCAYPMSPGDFSSAKQTISSKSFEDSKLSIAKQVFNSNCLLSSQVKEIMQLFSFEDSKLAFAKYAYGLTFDPGNYFKVNDAFSFESSSEELNEYITGYKK